MITDVAIAETVALHRPTVILTPKGQAVTAVYRVLALLRELDDAERADVLELLNLELEEHGLNG